MNKFLRNISLFIIVVALGAPAVRADEKASEEKSASNYACHFSALRAYYPPAANGFDANYKGSRYVRVAEETPFEDIIVPTPDGAAYVVYHGDSDITYFPKPKSALKSGKAQTFKFQIGKKTTYVVENDKGVMTDATQVWKKSEGHEGFVSLAAATGDSFPTQEEMDKILLPETTRHVEASCKRKKADSSKESAERLTLTLYTCARVLDEGIRKAAEGQAVNCGLESVLPKNSDKPGSTVTDDGGSTGPGSGKKPDDGGSTGPGSGKSAPVKKCDSSTDKGCAKAPK